MSNDEKIPPSELILDEMEKLREDETLLLAAAWISKRENFDDALDTIVEHTMLYRIGKTLVVGIEEEDEKKVVLAKDLLISFMEMENVLSAVAKLSEGE